MAEAKKFKFPKTMGACADRLYELKAKKAEAKRVTDAIEEEEKALKAHIIETLPKSEASGIAGKVARVKIEEKEVPQVKDWDAFYKYVKRTNSFDMMQRRLTDTAVMARIDAGKPLPGVEMFKYKSISLTKV